MGDAAELLTLFQDTRLLDLLDLDRIYFPHSWIHEFTRYWPKYPLCDFLGHHGLSLMEGYFNLWDAGYLTEIVDTCSPFSLLSSLSRNPISPLIIIDFQSLAQEETRTSAKGLESQPLCWGCHPDVTTWNFCSRYKDTEIVTSLYILQLLFMKLCKTTMSIYGKLSYVHSVWSGRHKLITLVLNARRCSIGIFGSIMLVKGSVWLAFNVFPLLIKT